MYAGLSTSRLCTPPGIQIAAALDLIACFKAAIDVNRTSSADGTSSQLFSGSNLMTWMRTPPESVFSTASKGPLASAQPAKSKNSGRSLLIFIWPSDLSHEIPRCESPAEWGSGALRRDVRINHHAHRNGRFGAPKLQWRSLPVRLAGATG